MLIIVVYHLIQYVVNVKLSLCIIKCQATKKYWEEDGQFHAFSTLVWWMFSGLHHALECYVWGNRCLQPFERRLDGPKPVRIFCKRKEICSSQESNQFPRHPACSLASTLTEINTAPRQKILSYKWHIHHSRNIFKYPKNKKDCLIQFLYSTICISPHSTALIICHPQGCSIIWRMFWKYGMNCYHNIACNSKLKQLTKNQCIHRCEQNF